jgi:Domain of unknown function (DUF222)/HNH endonuclease
MKSCALVKAEEQVSRLVGSSQARSAAEVAERSRFELGTGGLSMRNGFRNPVPFLEHLTRAPQADLYQRVKLGAAIRDRVALTGERLPAEFPFVAAGLSSGLMSTEAATVIIRQLRQAQHGAEATPERRDVAEQALTELATLEYTDVVVAASRVWRDALDPDGVEPRYEEILHRRGLTKGREHNGITHWHLATDPRSTALLDAVLEDATTPGAVPRFMSDDDRVRGTTSSTDEAGNTIEVLADPRSREQKQLDVIVGVLTAGIRASHDAAPDLRATGTIIATISLAELEAGQGTGWLTGSNEPIPASVLQQMACDAKIRVMVLGKNGKPLYETVLDRYFTPTQKRAMIIRDGPQCVGIGCHNPASWCDGHHVVFHADGSPTNLDNGVLLCASCHAALHNDAFELTMIDGIPYLRLGIDAWDDSAWRPAGRPRPRIRAA